MTIPESIDAAPVFSLHIPPVTDSVNVVVAFTHTVSYPVMVPALSGVSTEITMRLEVAKIESPVLSVSTQVMESPLFSALVVYVALSVPVFVPFSFQE